MVIVVATSTTTTTTTTTATTPPPHPILRFDIPTDVYRRTTAHETSWTKPLIDSSNDDDEEGRDPSSSFIVEH